MDSITHKFCFTNVVEVDNKSSAELFDQAKIWIINSYNSPKRVIEIEDKDLGTIVAKGVIGVNARALGIEKPFGYVEYKFTINVKDGRYRYRLTDFYYYPEDCAGEKLEYKVFCLSEKQMVYIRQQVDRHCRGVLISFNEGMKTTKVDAW